MNKLKESYNKYRNGDSLSDEELMLLLDNIKLLSNTAFNLGDTWYLTYSQGFRDLVQLESFAFHRGLM